MTKAQDGVHSKSLEELAGDAEKHMRLRGIVSVRVEVPVYFGFVILPENHQGSKPPGGLITEIDLIWELKNNIYVVGEYKTHDSCKQRDKATHQLIYAEKAIKVNYDPMAVLMTYIHDRNPYIVEALTISNDRRNFHIIKE